MKIEIYIPGKLSRHLLGAYDFYLDKIKRFAKIRVNFTKLGGDLNRISKEVILKKEAEEISRKLNGKEFYLIDLHGKKLDSYEFSMFLENQKLKGELNIVIGGPLGIDKTLIDKSKGRISLSKLTFTHELALILVLEQIFRGFKIINNEKYHY
ncbi:MAG: 23S rRNA (pseudouridine(1915)-N(3))-methyltransferase RlmH [Thermosipho sp. (in: Bacteria)]|nr:23S rRNA (pseudouridine(1915)-N(3))-methyltransferase RlmH [Thermosipho sp. (in: thermotogales)]